MAKKSLRIYFMLFVGLLFVAGCAPAVSPKPEATTTGPSAKTSRDDARVKSGGQSGGAKESDLGTSSIDALRGGKPAITPRSSPLQDVRFDFDRYDLSAEARGTLRTNAEWLKNNPAVRVDIEGHCDERGTNDYNLALGAKRAAAARDYLVSLGITPDRMSTTSFGEEISVCKEATESCWLQNRRARFVVLDRRPTS
jgi:peptidoglycan-associated lipoprotein